MYRRGAEGGRPAAMMIAMTAAALILLSKSRYANAFIDVNDMPSPSSIVDNVGGEEKRGCQWRRCVVEYIRVQGLPEHYWRRLEEEHVLHDRHTMKRIMLDCSHRYAVLSRSDKYLLDLMKMRRAANASEPEIFQWTHLAQNWRLHLVDDRPQWHIKGKREDRNDELYNVFPVTNESLRAKLLSDTFGLAMERWLFQLTRKPISHQRDLVANRSSELFELLIAESPFSYPRWCQMAAAAAVNGGDKNDDGGDLLDLDVGVIESSSRDILAISSSTGASIRLNAQYEWYIRLTDVRNSSLSESLEFAIRDIYRRRKVSRINGIGFPTRSDNLDIMYSVHAVMLNELSNYFGFVVKDNGGGYPPAIVETPMNENNFPSYTSFDGQFRMLLSDVSGLVYSWRMVPFLTARLLAHNDDDCVTMRIALSEISRWLLLLEKLKNIDSVS